MDPMEKAVRQEREIFSQVAREIIDYLVTIPPQRLAVRYVTGRLQTMYERGAENPAVGIELMRRRHRLFEQARAAVQP